MDGRAGVADGIVDHIADHRADQLAIKKAHQSVLGYLIAALNGARPQDVVMACQLGLQKVIQLQIAGAQRQLIDVQLVQPEHLHQHAVQAHGLVLNHTAFGGAVGGGRQVRDQLPVGLHQQAKGVFHVMHG